VQSGNTQPPSRTARALRWAGVTTRLARPTSNGWLGAPPRTGSSKFHGGPQPSGEVPRTTGFVLQGRARVAGGVAGDQHPGDRPVTGQPPARLGAQGAGPADLPTHRAGLGQLAAL
jgi:hypothetical protein